MRDAMAAVRGALDALASNADASQDAVLCLNARDARTGLARRLDQLSPATLRSAVRGCGSPNAYMLTADDGGAPSP